MRIAPSAVGRLREPVRHEPSDFRPSAVHIGRVGRPGVFTLRPSMLLRSTLSVGLLLGFSCVGTFSSTSAVVDAGAQGRSRCGDGVVDANETCDGNCRASCDDGNACTQEALLGRPEDCDVRCVTRPVSACQSGDGCCPSNCTAASDLDCSSTCGDGIVDAPETCDGNCPSNCNDGNTCTQDTLSGTASNCNAFCRFTTITQCQSGDGCCPPGCLSGTDADCSALCGNGVVDSTETCDGNCPLNCNDGNACTTDTLGGSASTCSASCTHQPVSQCRSNDGCCPAGCTTASDTDCSPTCGNGVVETNETCDGNCPTTCNDGNACTLDHLTGSAQACSVACRFQAVTACTSSDGCCPPGCSSTVDTDCSPTCGNGTIEGTEKCDGNCPTSCSDGNACTLDSLTGSAAQCSAACSFQPITQCQSGDGCCPPGCSSTLDTDCSAKCGNGIVEGAETCDGNCPMSCNDANSCTRDTLTGSAANCSAACSYQPVTQCTSGDGCCPTGCDFTTDSDCACTNTTETVDSAAATETIGSAWVTGQTSLAVDHANGLHVTYFDGVNKRLRYGYKPSGGTTWALQNVSADVFRGNPARALAIDATDRIHLCYWDAASSTLKYATRTMGGAWSFESIATAADVNHKWVASCSLALDNTGGVHLIYPDYEWAATATGPTILSLMYAVKAAGSASWTKTSVVQDGHGERLSLAIDVAGGVHISYGGTLYVWYAYLAHGGTWIHPRPPGQSNFEITSTSISVDSLQAAHLAFSSEGGNSVRYASRSAAGVWGPTAEYVSLPNTEQRGDTCAVTVGRQNDVHVTYRDRAQDALIHATRADAGTWVRTVLDPGPGVGRGSDVVVDQSGRVRVSYLDDTHAKVKVFYLNCP